MPWLKLKFRADNARAQTIADALENLGALAVSLKNKGVRNSWHSVKPITPEIKAD